MLKHVTCLLHCCFILPAFPRVNTAETWRTDAAWLLKVTSVEDFKKLFTWLNSKRRRDENHAPFFLVICCLHGYHFKRNVWAFSPATGLQLIFLISLPLPRVVMGAVEWRTAPAGCWVFMVLREVSELNDSTATATAWRIRMRSFLHMHTKTQAHKEINSGRTCI